MFEVHQFGLFEFKTGRDSRPSTPTARSKAAIFGLDAISRNLFNTRPGSAMGDFFAGSVNSRRRTKSTASRSSMYTQTTTTTGDGSLTRFSRRSNSTATAATTVSVMDDDSSFYARPSSRSRTVLKKGKSPGPTTPESERASPSRSLSRSSSVARSRSASRERGSDYSDVEEDIRDMDSSEWDLAMQLALARKNSQNQHGKSVVPTPLERPSEATIYEGR